MAGLSAAAIRDRMRALGDARIAEHSARYFKAGKGEYGEGDRFHGIRVPVTRKLVREYRDAPERTVVALLRSGFHEERLLAVLLLVDRFKRGDDSARERVFDTYIRYRAFVNNWDIVDSSAHHIVGSWLESRDRRLLYELARSDVIWDRRIAMMATLHYICSDDFDDALAIAGMLRNDAHDLIHKAVGWMLREIGNRDRAVEERYLKRHYRRMPRTMLRYAIEKFPERLRLAYLHGEV